MEIENLKNIKGENIQTGKKLQGVRCHVLGDFYKRFNNSRLEDAELIIISESMFHRYNVEEWISKGKEIVLVLDPWDDKVMMQYINDFGIRFIVRSTFNDKQFLDFLRTSLEKELKFINIDNPTIKKPTEREIKKVLTKLSRPAPLKNSFYESAIPRLELPALPGQLPQSGFSLEDFRLKIKAEADRERQRKLEAILKKVEIRKFLAQYDYPPIEAPLPGGQYVVFSLPSFAGKGISKEVLSLRVAKEIWEREKERKERTAALIRDKKLKQISSLSLHTTDNTVIAIPPFKGFEHCINVDLSEIDSKRAGVLLLLGYAFHACFPTKLVVVNLDGIEAKGETTLDINFEIGEKIGDYTIGNRGGIVVKAKKQDGDLLLISKSKRIVIPKFFRERNNFHYSYLRNRDILDSLVESIDKHVNEIIMKMEKRNGD